MICEHPRITAQGLWNACWVGEWLEWLVIEVCDYAGEDRAAVETIASITGSGPNGWQFPKGAPLKHLADAKKIRAQYESPWLA